jgi:hypothetical protein
MAPEQDETMDAIPGTEAAEAASPEAARPASTEAQAEPSSLLDAALKALGSTKPEVTAADAATAGDPPDRNDGVDEGASQAEGQDGLPHIPDAEFKALPKSVRTAVNQMRQRVRALAPQAERGAAVETYLQQAGLTIEEFREGQEVMALIKRDPRAALAKLEERVTELRRYVGVDLPDDLQQDVEAGYITEERARELSQERAGRVHAEQSLRATTQATAQHAMLSDVAAWESTIRQTDPDFARKLPFVQEKARLAVLSLGRPVRDGAEAVGIVKQAYADTNAMLRGFAPQPAATRPSPASAASAPAASVQPKNIYEAARMALRA